MLSHIYLKDFAIIEKLDLELKTGMTALTGETGAGKSILIDAIGLVLGDRADSGVVRHGAEKTEITLSVDIDDTPSAKKWLIAQDLIQDDADDECILRRVITASGKSRAWINGSPCNLKMMRELGEQLVDIHGQHEHQSLMKKVMQRSMLDDFAGNQQLIKKVAEAYESWKTLTNKLSLLSNQNSDHQAKLDLLRFQTQELDDLQLSENESKNLDEEHARLSNSGQLIETSSHSVVKLYDADEQSIYSNISDVLQGIEAAKSLDSALQEPLELLQNAQIQIQEAADLLRRYHESVELDPERLDWVNQRLSNFHDLARKHQTTPDQLFEKWQLLHEQLASLSGDEYDLDALQESLNQCEKEYIKAAEALSKSRYKSAKLLSSGVSKEMQQLGMEGGKFIIEINSNENYSNYGIDDIEFMVSANPGQPLKALNKVASGGELSRISLAIQMIAAQKITLPALIFDEVDSGIGGGIAEVVGKQLRKLGANRQVLCVTHLPQVASCAHNHHKVTKIKNKKSTSTGMLVLDKEQRVVEIARMMGGIDITQTTLNLAEEMLAN
ncbi:MAG: DNA repair protein RecN (Recombination protein N) [Cocleimonas sp.]|jgi:DNA repair protein RecN (Recombination protein N)